MKIFRLIRKKAGQLNFLLLAVLFAPALITTLLLARTGPTRKPSSWARFDYLLPSQSKHKLHSEITVLDTEFTPSIIPVSLKDGWVSSEFGLRKHHPVTSRKDVMHYGIDLAVYTGTPVKASANGLVTFAGRKGGYGRTLKIDHLNGLETLYAHNKRLKVKKGDFVKKGDVVAFSGNTGVSTGPHLHYEIRVANKPINPRKYMPELPSRNKTPTGKIAIGAAK